MKVLQFSRFGPPDEVLELISQTDADPDPGEILISIEAAPIAPGDLANIEGEEAMLRDVAQDGDLTVRLPQVPGIEGVGRVVAVGKGVKGWKEGDRSFLPVQGGTWRSHILVKARDMIPAPEGDPYPLAMLVSRWTAFFALTDIVSLKAGDWFLQNAANSDVGMSLIRLARGMGIRTANVVRRESVIPELTAIGADVVAVDGPNLVQQIKEGTGSAEIKVGLDAVGGDASDRLARCLTSGGVLANYGHMSSHMVHISTSLFLYKNIKAQGFYAGQPLRRRPPSEQRRILMDIAQMAVDGTLPARVAGTYALEDYKAAVVHAAQSAEDRPGKVLFVP